MASSSRHVVTARDRLAPGGEPLWSGSGDLANSLHHEPGLNVRQQAAPGTTWIDAVNRVLDLQNVVEIISVRNIKDVPLNEQISLVEAKLPFTSRKSTSTGHFAQIHWE